MTSSPWMTAFLFGAFAAISLPLGAMAGVWMRPSARFTAAVMAFGAGALLAAMSFELVLPSLESGEFGPMALGFILGCVLFVALNHVLNVKGGFLRKAATLAEYARGVKRRKLEVMLEELSQVDIFRRLPPEEIHALAPYVTHIRRHAGDIIFDQGDPGDALYIVEEGKVAIMRTQGERVTTLAHLGPGQSFGEMALLTPDTRMASAVALEPLTLGKIDRDDFHRLTEMSPLLKDAVTQLMEERTARTEALLTSEEWRARAMESLDRQSWQPTNLDIHEVVRDARRYGTAGYAIWLGSMLDGVGESVVIGASTLDAVSVPLLLGVLMANIPESMSSAGTLRRQGASTAVILLMWLFVVLVSGVCAALGSIFLSGAAPGTFSFVEGMAAGAILAMLAQTMLPEAFEHGGGNAVSLMTAAGFLAAILLGLVSG
ncbi:MAG: cyclic nucleotide-binding domain-containing protein [Gemmatimonadota bacterium]